MDTKKIKEMFPDKELREVITGSPEDIEITENVFAPNLLNLSKEKQDRFIKIYFECLAGHCTSADHKNDARRLTNKFIDKSLGYTFSPDLLTSIEKATSVYSTWFSLYVEESAPLGKFPKGNIKLGNFKEALETRSEELGFQENFVRKHSSLDEPMNKLLIMREQRAMKGFAFDEVQIGNSQNYILLQAPRNDDPNSVDDYLTMAIEKRAPLLITLCSPWEWEHIAPFYEPEYATQAKLPPGWKIECGETKVLYEGSVASQIPKAYQDEFANVTDMRDEKLKKFRPRIVERTLVATKGATTHTMTHLHYENWPDNEKAPDLNALEALFRRRDELVQDLSQPIVINCKGGVGRTSAFALMDWCRKEIQAQAKTEGSLDDLVLNIPEMMYQMKYKAPRIGGSPNPPRFAQIYEVAYLDYQTRVLDTPA